jgi:hypothetical protein
VNPAALFLLGGVAMAVVLSVVVWLFSRPKNRVEDPNHLRNTLRALRMESRDRPRPTHGEGGVRILDDDDHGSGSVDGRRDG